MSAFCRTTLPFRAVPCIAVRGDRGCVHSLHGEPSSPSSAKQGQQYLGLTHELRRGGAQDAPRVSVEVVRLVEGALTCVLQPKPVQTRSSTRMMSRSWNVGGPSHNSAIRSAYSEVAGSAEFFMASSYDENSTTVT
jgi:hypothetical protein